MYQEDEDRRLPRNYKSEHGLNTKGFAVGADCSAHWCNLGKLQAASMDTALAPSNKGYKLLMRMGWKEGAGLGKQRQGRYRLAAQSCG